MCCSYCIVLCMRENMLVEYNVKCKQYIGCTQSYNITTGWTDRT